MSLIVAALLLLQDTEGAELVKKAVESTQAQKSFETAFKARFSPPQGATLDYQGRQVWVAPGILYMAFTGSGGLDKKIIRAGNDVWVHHSLHGWDTAAGSGDDGAARGIQHPLEILGIVGRQAAAAKGTQTGASILLSGDDLQAALKHHVQGNAVAWARSTAQVDLTVDAAGRLKTLSCNALLLANNPAQGRSRYEMDVSFVGFNTVTELKFTDEKERPILPLPLIQERVAKVLESKKP